MMRIRGAVLYESIEKVVEKDMENVSPETNGEH